MLLMGCDGDGMLSVSVNHREIEFWKLPNVGKNSAGLQLRLQGIFVSEETDFRLGLRLT